MPRMIEISGQIGNGMWDYNVLDLGGAVLPPVRVERVASIGQHGFDAHALQFSTLTGTYLETAAHMIEGRPTIDQILLQDFIKPAKIMRLPNVGPRTLIRLDDLRRHAPRLEPGDALLLAPLVNLDQISQLEGTLIAFPLNIVGVCSTPCRAIFVEGTGLFT
jgi:kynurenine formamidase